MLNPNLDCILSDLSTLKLILTQEHGLKLLLLLQETGCLNGKIRSIWEWDELS